MKKKLIRLPEVDIRNIIFESVMRILNEDAHFSYEVKDDIKKVVDEIERKYNNKEFCGHLMFRNNGMEKFPYHVIENCNKRTSR